MMKSGTAIFFAGALLAATAQARECGMPADLKVTNFERQSTSVQQMQLAQFASMTYEQVQKHLEAGGSYGAISGNIDQDSFNEFKQSMQSYEAYNLFINYASEIITTFGDPGLIEAYKACLGTLSPITVKAELQARSARLILGFDAQPQDNNPATIRDKTDLALHGARVTYDSCSSNNTIPARGTCTIELALPDDALRGVPFTVTTDRGEQHAYIPPRVSFKKIPESFEKYSLAPQYSPTGAPPYAPHVDIQVIADAIGTAVGCTAPTNRPWFYEVTDQTAVNAGSNSHPDYQGMTVFSQTLTTSKGLRNQVCFSYNCQWRGYSEPGAGRSCRGSLSNLSLVYLGWVRDY